MAAPAVAEFGADKRDSVDVDDDEEEDDDDDGGGDADCLPCDRSTSFASVTIWRCADASLERPARVSAASEMPRAVSMPPPLPPPPALDSDAICASPV